VLRKAHRIRIAGGDAPPPLRDFAELSARFGAPRRLLTCLAAEGWAEPTPIQRQAVPALMAGQELLAVATTVRARATTQLRRCFLLCRPRA
jgi:superfamily II DNA/RNA helicase